MLNKRFLLGMLFGLMVGVAMLLLLNRPKCPACPKCPDCRPKLQLQPFNLDAKALEKIKRSNITIYYTPTYSGDVMVNACDSMPETK